MPGDVEAVRRSIGADSLGYASLESLVPASEQPRNRLCTACFTGEYPIAIPDQVGKHVLEGIARGIVDPAHVRGVAGDATRCLPPATAAADALSRP